VFVDVAQKVVFCVSKGEPCRGLSGICSRYALAEAAAMHLHVYRDESRSAHIDVEGEGDHPWTFDIVTVMAVAILVVGFVGAFAAHLIR
jgi:hypothetical protein